jgi:hypothetical protein
VKGLWRLEVQKAFREDFNTLDVQKSRYYGHSERISPAAKRCYRGTNFNNNINIITQKKVTLILSTAVRLLAPYVIRV